MSDPISLRMQDCLDRMRTGDTTARDELLRTACDRLERLTRRMLRDNPRVKRWEETADVLQNALLRLSRALSAGPPPAVQDFFRLATTAIRRELIDLARHHYGPEGHAAHHASHNPGEADAPPPEAAGTASLDPARAAHWGDFHRLAGELPAEEREVFDLLWYQGLTQQEAAGLIGVSDRTVKSRWRAARLRLAAAMGGEFPEE